MIDAKSPAMAELLRLIRLHEAGRSGYNADLRNDDHFPVTTSTLNQVIAFAKKQVAQGEPSSAIGGYQFLSKTLEGLKRNLKLTGNERMTPEFQDYLAIELMKGRGIEKYLAGTMSAEAFCNELAKEWASLPVVTRIRGPHRYVNPGQSYYAGDGLNAAGHKPEVILAAVRALKPASVPVDLTLRFGDGISTNQTAAYANAIKDAQRLLKAKGYYSGLVDGMFGGRTEAAVKLLQKDRRLVVDGIIGPKTWAALRSPNPAVAIDGLGEPAPQQPKETTMISGKQKMWMALVMPAVVTAVITGLDMLGIPIDENIKTGAIMILTALGVYQVPNKVA